MKGLFSSFKTTKKRNQIFTWFTSLPRVKNFQHSKELQLLAFFSFLFLIIILRLFQLQILEHHEYDTILSKQHYREAALEPERGNIYALDKGGHPVKLTENITLYDLALDPRELQWTFETNPKYGVPTQLKGHPMKPRFIEIITPVIYKHLCETNGMKTVTHEECVKNIELFAGVELLPKQPELFYLGNGAMSPEYENFDFTGYHENYQSILAQFTKEKAYQLIKQRLDEKIKIGLKTENYLGYFTEPKFLEEINKLQLPYLKVVANNYLYITPGAIANKELAKQTIKSLLKKWRYPIGANFDKLFDPQERKYIKLVSGLNPALAQEIKELKKKHRGEVSTVNKDTQPPKLTRTPVLYSLVLEPVTTRYYPYGEFMANILGYVDKAGNAFYGIEQYFDTMLKGKKGEIRGRTSAWLGNVGSNEFEISNPIDGNDIYLTIDIGLQREVEKLAKEQLDFLKADSINVLVLNTQNGELKASVNVPTFDPNNYNDAYTLIPLGRENAEIIDNLTYLDIPVYIFTGNTYKLATIAERQNPENKKYFAKNKFGSQVFVDRNISNPFEPGSIFKTFTVAIGLDTDEISMQDRYNDEGSVKVGTYTIKNVAKACLGYNTYMNALIFSCNVGMAKIIQTIGKYPFYNYLDKLGFGKLTGIELAGEKEGFVNGVSTIAFSRFINNAFGQGLSTTQMQLATAYAALVNGGIHITPTIIENIIDTSNPENTYNKNQTKTKIFKTDTSNTIKDAIYNVFTINPDYQKSSITGIKLGGKSGTAQITFRGRYQGGEGRTNGTFAGIITTDDPKYAVLIWIRRPRRNQW